jgi:two-component system OmpR family sensor kinase
LADDLLLLARADDGRLQVNLERVDVLDALDSVARSFRARADMEQRPVVVDHAGALVVTADRLRLEQAIRNMVDNAFRHGGGAVTLAARMRDGFAELHVEDEGRGFADGFAGRAFDRFSRADGRSSEGSGLGLAIVESVARAHHGAAHVRNRPQGGADVWLALPLSAD